MFGFIIFILSLIALKIYCHFDFCSPKPYNREANSIYKDISL